MKKLFFTGNGIIINKNELKMKNKEKILLIKN